MTGVINLRQARKRAARAESKTEADRNAARHGQSKAATRRVAAEQARAQAHLDGHRREDKD